MAGTSRITPEGSTTQRWLRSYRWGHRPIVLGLFYSFARVIELFSCPKGLLFVRLHYTSGRQFLNPFMEIQVRGIKFNVAEVRSVLEGQGRGQLIRVCSTLSTQSVLEASL